MKISLVFPIFILSFISCVNLFSQEECTYDFNQLMGVIYFPLDTIKYPSKSPKYYTEKAVIYYPCLDDSTLSPKQKSQISNLIASYYSESTQIDSIVKYAKMAVAYDPVWYCEMLQEEVNLDPELVARFKRHHILTSEEMREKIIGDFECDLSVKDEIEEKTTEPIIQNKEYANKLKILATRDQFTRIGNSLISHIQSKLDATNRVSLDSLFSLYSFPSVDQVGFKGVENAWLVLQHSTDCEWNKKWIVRFLDAHKENQIEHSFLLYTIIRFYKPIEGYCRNDNESAFIEMLKEKYSEDFAERFGYSEY